MNARRRRAAAAVVALAVGLAVLVAAAGHAEAHQSSVTYTRALVDGARVDVQLRLDRLDAAIVIGLEAAPDPFTDAQRAALATAVLGAIVIADGDAPCPAGPATVVADGPRLAVAWSVTCAAPIATFALTYDLLFAHDPNHNAALRVEVAGRRPATTLLDVDHARFVWPLAEAPPSNLRAFLRSGIHHVATGLDHLAFVLALLLAVVIVRDPGARPLPVRPERSPGPEGRDEVEGPRARCEWRLRPLGQALRATALVASAFTLAHSLTLIAAALGWVAVPAVVVESAIALSIVWTAVEDVIRPDVRWRFALTFAFGLVHGLGFARMLAVLLPPADRVVPLLAFNVGVELAHLAVIAVALPALWLLARAVGAHRYRTVVLPIAAGVLALLGAMWMIERAFGVTILGL